MRAAAWAWVGLVIVVAGYVSLFDWRAVATGRPTMSAQFHDWMQHQVAGPILVAVWVAVSAGFIYHFLINK